MPNKVIFSILDTSAFGGAEQYMFSHLRFLSHQGYHIILATNNLKVKEIMLSRLDVKEKEQFKIIRAPYRLDAIGNWKGLIKFFVALPRALIWAYVTMKRLSKTFDKVICLWPGYSDRSVFSPIAKYFNLPLIWIEFGTLEPIYKRNWGFPKQLFQIPSSLANHLITSSEYTQKSIVKNSRFNKHNISLVYPGTKIFTKDELEFYKVKASDWLKKNNLKQTTLLTVVGRLAHENEINMVVYGYSLLLKLHKKENYLLQIIGDGPQREELNSLVNKLNIQDKVIFRGFISEEDKRIMLSASTAFIFPRAWELDGFGMTTIEAMALGVPIVTTNFGPQIEIVKDGIDGFRYKPHDSNDLAKKLEQIVTLSAAKRNSMKKASLERVKAFADNISHQKMLEIIQKYG